MGGTWARMVGDIALGFLEFRKEKKKETAIDLRWLIGFLRG
jgi:hypothetical protein